MKGKIGRENIREELRGVYIKGLYWYIKNVGVGFSREESECGDWGGGGVRDIDIVKV